MTQNITPKPLNQKAFAAFGDVIEKTPARSFDINDGMATRFHDLASIQTDQGEGRPALNIFHGRPWAMPLEVLMMERHLLGSQAFVPLGPCRWLVVVAPCGVLDPGAICAFTANAGQGVNYRPGTWHHPLVVLDDPADFLVVDRVADEVDCDVAEIPPGAINITLG